LKIQLASQGKNLDAIKGSDIVTGKNPIRVQLTNPQGTPPGETSPEIHGAVARVEPDLSKGQYASQIILTTNKVMNGAKVRVKCPNKLNSATVWVAGSSQMFGGGVLEDDHTYMVNVSNPNWAPDYPIVIKVYHDTPGLGSCNIEPLP